MGSNLGNFSRISQLWRRKKLCCLILNCVAGKHPWMEIYSSQEDVGRALDHGDGVRVHDALRSAWRLGLVGWGAHWMLL